MDTRPIGIFDSGVGGLTVVKRVMQMLPNEKIVYFGDTARVPYGSKSKETVTRFSRQDIHFLLSKDVKAIVIACNTVTSNCIDILKEEFDIPLFGVVEPGVLDAINNTKNNKVGVIGTAATVRSGAYQRLIHKQNHEIEVYTKACPLFVPLVEEGWTDNEIAYLTAREYLQELLLKDVDAIVLGCTHYPLLKKCLKEIVGQKVMLIDPAYITAENVKNYLQQHHMLNQTQTIPIPEFYVSDPTEKFELLCSKALKHQYCASEINIEKF